MNGPTVSDIVVRHSLFIRAEMVRGGVPYYVKIWQKLTTPFINVDLQSIVARSASAN